MDEKLILKISPLNIKITGGGGGGIIRKTKSRKYDLKSQTVHAENHSKGS